jgi:hypothetical protein
MQPRRPAAPVQAASGRSAHLHALLAGQVGGAMSDYGGRLFPQHQALLADSAISVEVATERGYVSVDTKTRLERINVSPAGRRIPGLLVPLLRKDGSVWGYQYRPDSPRLNGANRAVKYETPAGQRAALDVPPGVGSRLDDPNVPLLVTEGTRKADSAWSHGLACVALPGVWSWRGTNLVGGKTALSEWHDVALNGRRLVLAFDSDVTTKRQVRTALTALAGYLESKGAKVEYLHLPDDDPGKTGLDDWIATHGAADLWAIVRPEPPMLDEESSSTPADNTATAQPSPAEPPKLAAEQRILDRFKVAVRGCGVVGEEATAATLYLLITSRLLPKPVSAAVKGHSSSGKSFTTETTVKFFPPEAVIEMTAMSERALVYNKEDYKHRTLVLYEAVALREGNDDNLTSYFVRSLLSEGRIEYPVTVKDKDGGFTTKNIVKTGPTNLIVTTTKTQIHAENETRLLSLSTDDSTEQTKRILFALADETDNQVDLDEWRQLQAWLQAAEHRVTIPYAKQLAELVPPVAVRLRRDFGAVLALVRAHAILHQQTRDRDEAGRIIADIDDYAQVRELIAELISEGVGTTVSATVRETGNAVAVLTDPEGVMARAVAVHLKLDKSNASRRLRIAGDGGYVRNLEDKRGKPGRWVVGDPMPDAEAVLPEPSQLCNTVADETAGQPSGCAVADENEGIETNDMVDPNEDEMPSPPVADATGATPQPLCAICSRPLGEAYVRLGRTTHPGCRATAGGAR